MVFPTEGLLEVAIESWPDIFVQCSHFISVFAFVSRHICFKRSLAQVITFVVE